MSSHIELSFETTLVIQVLRVTGAISVRKDKSFILGAAGGGRGRRRRQEAAMGSGAPHRAGTAQGGHGTGWARDRGRTRYIGRAWHRGSVAVLV